jgi:drug/metabolite transporter (DMT)-like permease
MTTKSSQNWLPTYLGLGTIWGLSFLFIAWANVSLSPLGVAFWRMVLGTLPMVVLALLAKNNWPRDWRIWAKVAVTSFCMNALPGVLFAFAELHATSAFAGIMNGSTPIWTLVFILLFFRAEKPAPNVLVGLGIGLVGVLLVLQVWNGLGENDPLSVGALTLAVLLYGIGGPYTRRFVSPLKLDPNVQISMQIGMAVVMLAPFYLVPAAFGAPLFIGPLTVTAIIGLLVLGVVGTGLAYVAYYALMNSAGSAVANSVTYLSPVVAVLAGALVLGEHLTWNELVGGAIVILGAAVSQGYFKRKVAAPTSPATPGPKA